MANDQRNGVVHVTSQLKCATIVPHIITLKEIHGEKQPNIIFSFFCLFQQKQRQSGNSKHFYFKRANMKTSQTFASSSDI